MPDNRGEKGEKEGKRTDVFCGFSKKCVCPFFSFSFRAYPQFHRFIPLVGAWQGLFRDGNTVAVYLSATPQPFTLRGRELRYVHRHPVDTALPPEREVALDGVAFTYFEVTMNDVEVIMAPAQFASVLIRP